MPSIKDKMMIGNLKINGRIVMPPMATYKCGTDEPKRLVTTVLKFIPHKHIF